MTEQVTKKNLGGRPKSDPQEKKDFVVSFRYTASQFTRLKEKADKAGLTPNQYAAKSCLTGSVHITKIDSQELAFEDRHALRRIGTTLFQLRQHIYQGETVVDPEVLEGAIADVSKFLADCEPPA